MFGMTGEISERTRKWIACCIIFALTLTEIVHTAWYSDDFLITMRTILNFLNGFGPVFNIDERVQAYTHPLWFFLISGLSVITHNIITAMYTLSIVCSLSTIGLLISSVARTVGMGLLGATILLLSKCYVDFSTSGLENPLSHLLIVLCIIYSKPLGHSNRQLMMLFLTLSLLYLTRPDLPLLMIPTLLQLIIQYRRSPVRLFKTMLPAIFVVLLWTAFSLYYYGFPLPNTAYAKLNLSIPTHDLIIQGIRYIQNSLLTDPLTLTVIYVATYLSLNSSPRDRALILGVWLYLFYIISIGGDFMSGRFLTAPLLLSVAIITRTTLSKTQLKALLICIGLLGAVNLKHTLLSNTHYYNQKIINGIADERGFYITINKFWQDFKLITPLSEWHAKHPKFALVTCGGLGIAGITSGPGVHLLDQCALVDPLLAHLPALNTSGWRIGHFFRAIPEGYKDSLRHNDNELTNINLKARYEAIRILTRNPLNDPTRLKTLVRIYLTRNYWV